MSDACLDIGERTRFALMIVLGVLIFLKGDERKSLGRKLEIMDIMVDEAL
jgi:hypothetical protein